MVQLGFALFACLVVRSTAISVPFVVAKDASDPFNFENNNNIAGGDIYVGSLTAGGAVFQVQLDTGSSDLWLDTTSSKPSGTQDTGLTGGLSYGDGTVAQGPILIANVTFGNFSVPQAFISAPGTNATTNGDTGLLGVGPPSLSAIAATLQNSTFNGTTLMQNIFAANPSEPNFITFQLSRSEATGVTSGGTFTIGEVNSTLSGISNAPKLNVVSQSRWIVFMDGITVNGNNFSGNSQLSVTGQGPTQTLANLDSGTSLAEIPKLYADAIYSGVPGAQYDASSGIYNVPCDAKIDLSFIFSGIAYPVHPIDTVQAGAATKGTVSCFGGFRVSVGGDPDEDFLLGDTFLRNVYSLYDFGSFISGTTPPFLQLLSTTDASTADSEFSTLSAQRNASITGKAPSSGGGGGSGGGSGGTSGGGSGASQSMSLPTILLSVIGLGLGMAMI